MIKVKYLLQHLPAAKVEFRFTVHLVALLTDAIQFDKLGNVVLA